ncbi:IS21-like element helper ATPase IstB [Acaryochloris marina]|uniref:Transposase-associated ATP-binding protein, putative n=1 Tax=Acaryochloris marina (strain MBIC 11017) TaxID=329726 RepID=A8ZLW3_ACAM1|nr:IS21-like element helper ATPase IstB [Acaryochloris marina]ABW31732.1 transposase-associated ATP-binding protein, putative [Acaryochloris marina MBIC11017]BDM83059.1 ATPase AAA [Acaryochloris marina MBIC10699]
MQAMIEQLQHMKLTGLLEAWREQQALPTYHDLSFDERLALMVEREYIRRQNQRMQRRLRQARLPVHATLDAVDFDVPRGLKKIQFLEFAQGHWLQENLSLIFLGPTGVGKSFLAAVLAHHLCKQGHTVRYIKTADLLLELKLTKADGSYPKLRKQLAAYDLLVLDEWLRDPLSLYEAREILDVLDERFRKASCLFATQIPVEQWHPQIQDPTLADAILDRIVHDAMKVSLRGESMRKLTSKLIPQKENDNPALSTKQQENKTDAKPKNETSAKSKAKGLQETTDD